MIWWQPKPLLPPQVDPDLPHLDGITRSAESIRYSILSIEFWISPNGQGREWLRHNARVASWLVMPALVVLPLVVFILWQLVKCVVMLVAIAGKVVILPLLLLLAGLAILVVVNIAKAVFR